MSKLLTKEDLLIPAHKEVSCPNAGAVSILPYISAGGMEAYEAHKDDPHRAFRALLEKTVNEGGPRFDDLTESDLDVIARCLAESEGFVESYLNRRSDSGVVASFHEALQDSDLWRNHVRSSQLIARSLRSFELNAIGNVAARMRETDRMLATIRPLTFVGRSAFDITSEWRRYRTRLDRLVPRLHAIDDMRSRLASNAELFRQSARLKSQFDKITAFDDQIRTVQSILRPVVEFRSSFIGMADRLRSNVTVTGDILKAADEAMERARSVVLRTNEYFRPVEDGPAVADEATDSPEVAEAGDSVESARFMLHEESGDLIVLGGDAVRIIADAVESQIDKKVDEIFQPYSHLMERMEKLSRPSGFLDMLHDFSTIITRDHWTTFWASPGDRWHPRPESVAKMALSVFLQGQWQGVAFVGCELANGAGFVDVLVNFLGRDCVVELKMVGAGWGIGRATEGLKQLDYYMGNYNCPEAFLVVFDGRRTETGEHLEDQYQTKNGIVNVVRVRVFSDAPTR